MGTLRNWLLPLILAVGQTTLLWAGTDLTGGPLSGTATALLVLAPPPRNARRWGGDAAGRCVRWQGLSRLHCRAS